MKFTIIVTVLAAIVAAVLAGSGIYYAYQHDSAVTELAKRKEAEAISQCLSAGGTIELLWAGNGMSLHACNISQGAVSVR